MIQIFRTDNPLLATGMKITQRLCYFNAMLHFLYAVPRLIFLLAPLVYMVFGLTIIPGYWIAILAYALPHLIISSLTNSRVQGRHRHSFWNEIYETVLAPYILMPTLLALINPKLGEFNVTDKGSTLAETRFDRRIAAPTTWLLALNVLGICMTPYRLSVTDPAHPGTVLCNLAWIFFNMIILGVAGAVANEQKQRRSSVRIPAKIAVELKMPGGGQYAGVTTDMSVGGASVICLDAENMARDVPLKVAFPQQTGDAQVSATIVGKTGNEIRLQFDAASIAEQEILTRALYSRANSWMGARQSIEQDRPLVSLGRVMHLSFIGFGQMLRAMLPEKSAKTGAALLVIVLALTHGTGMAQIPGAVTAAPEATQAAPAAPVVAPAVAPAVVVDDSAPLPPPDVTMMTANDTITLKQMGVQTAIAMHGPHNYYQEGFVLPHDRIPRKATLELTYHFNPAILTRTGSIRAYVNGTPVGVINAPKQAQADGEYAFASLNVPADILSRNNDLTFEFTGGTPLQVDTKAKAIVLASIGDSSRILIAGDSVPLKTDLGLLPLPFFDPDMQTTTTIPFVFLSTPTPKMLQAASVVASWFGIQASTRPIHYTVAVGRIPLGNVVVFANPGTGLASLLNIPAGGPSLSIRTNPSDTEGSALVLAGDDDEQLLLVARSLALMKVAHPKPGEAPALLGDSVRLADFPLPPPRKPDDAPRWLTTERMTSLWSYSSEQAMQSNGSQPIPVYFRVPPDLYYGETQNLNLRIDYRYNARAVADGSALRFFTNGALINEIPLFPGTEFADRQRNVLLPVAEMRPFGNTFLFNFDFIPSHPGDDGQDAAQRLQGVILKNSALDIRGLDHWARMPNLELFANAGFPFTRKADLADTTVVVPMQPTANEIELLLYLMSHCGMQTGYPALRVQVAGPDAVMSGDNDYLILGGTDDQPAFAPIEPSLPVTLDADGVHVKEPMSYLHGLQKLWLRSGMWKWVGGAGPESQPSNASGAPDLMIEGIQSPYYAGRSIVVVSLRNDDAVEEFANVFLERSQSSDIAHSVSLLRNGRFTSYAMETATYHVGYISRYAVVQLWLVEHFWILMGLVVLLSLVMAAWIRDYLVWLAAERLAVDKA